MYLYRTAVPGAEMFGDGYDADDFEGTRHGTGTLGRRYDNIRYLNERHGGPIEVCSSTRPGRLLCTTAGLLPDPQGLCCAGRLRALCARGHEVRAVLPHEPALRRRQR